MYYATFQYHYRFGHDFNFWLPGLEMKFACEAAEKVGAELKFMGAELDPVTWLRLYHETRMNVPSYIWTRFMYNSTQWTEELESNRQKLD